MLRSQIIDATKIMSICNVCNIDITNIVNCNNCKNDKIICINCMHHWYSYTYLGDEQLEEDAEWTQNDKFICIACLFSLHSINRGNGFIGRSGHR